MMKTMCATTTNPQEKFILVGVQPLLENLLFIFNSQNIYLDNDDPW